MSEFHDPIGNIRIGNHPRVSALMSGIFNKRPPQIKYQFIWDVETTLDFLRKLTGNDLFLDNSHLSLVMLNHINQCHSQQSLGGSDTFLQ